MSTWLCSRRSHLSTPRASRVQLHARCTCHACFSVWVCQMLDASFMSRGRRGSKTRTSWFATRRTHTDSTTPHVFQNTQTGPVSELQVRILPGNAF